MTTAVLVLTTSLLFGSIAQAGTTVPASQSLDKGEVIVLSEADQRKADVEFNQRRLLRFHQLWNLYLLRNENEARELRAEFEASFRLDAEPLEEAEIAAAEREQRETQVINIPLSKETSKLRAAANKKDEFNTTARKESDLTRIGTMHAGAPPSEVSEAIRRNSTILEKRLRAEIRLGGERASKAQANLDYLKQVLLPKLEDRQYFEVSRRAFAQEFKRVLGNGIAQ